MLHDPVDTSPRQAADLLGEVVRVRRRTRRSLGVPWFPLLCFGALNMLSAPLIVVAGLAVLAPLWLVAGSAGMLLIHRHYRRRAQCRGVTGLGRRAWTIAAAMFSGCLAAALTAGLLGGAEAGFLAPIIVIFIGYLVLGWLLRTPLPPLVVAPGAALAIALLLGGLAPWLVELTFGAALMAAGAALRALEARS